MGSVHNVHALYIPYCFSRSFVMPAGLRGLDGCYRNNNFSVPSLPWANTKQLHLPVTETIISYMYFLSNKFYCGSYYRFKDREKKIRQCSVPEVIPLCKGVIMGS